MTDYLQSLTQEELASLRLDQDPSGRFAITWPGDYNSYTATVGRFLGPLHRDRTAIIFESSSGATTLPR